VEHEPRPPAWQTYAPDGRQVRIERDAYGWVVTSSAGGRGAGRSLTDALADALGFHTRLSLLQQANSAEAEWISQQATAIGQDLADSDHEP